MDKEKELGAKRAQVANACLTCRLAKLKCSGEHPHCSRCIDRGLLCEYDTLEGRTKRQQLRHDLTDRQEELERAMAVLNHLQNSSDHEAANSLAHLRMGSSIETEFVRIRAKQSSAAQNPDGTQSSQQSTNDEDSETTTQRQRLREPPRSDAQQSGAQTSWSGQSDSRSGYTALNNADDRTENWDNIAPQMLDAIDPTSQDLSKYPFR